MPTTVTVDYDCPAQCTYQVPTALRDDQTLLRNAALADTLIMLADQRHDQECPHTDVSGQGTTAAT